jgi:hypothetical protein
VIKIAQTNSIVYKYTLGMSDTILITLASNYLKEFKVRINNLPKMRNIKFYSMVACSTGSTVSKGHVFRLVTQLSEMFTKH